MEKLTIDFYSVERVKHLTHNSVCGSHLILQLLTQTKKRSVKVCKKSSITNLAEPDLKSYLILVG